MSDVIDIYHGSPKVIEFGTEFEIHIQSDYITGNKECIHDV